jgi:hypothetical protein
MQGESGHHGQPEALRMLLHLDPVRLKNRQPVELESVTSETVGCFGRRRGMVGEAVDLESQPGRGEEVEAVGTPDDDRLTTEGEQTARSKLAQITKGADDISGGHSSTPDRHPGRQVVAAVNVDAHQAPAGRAA